jgi:hypothetical protein
MHGDLSRGLQDLRDEENTKYGTQYGPRPDVGYINMKIPHRVENTVPMPVPIINNRRCLNDFIIV